MQDNTFKSVQHFVLRDNLQMRLRPARIEDAGQLLAFVEQISGESENITFGPGEFGMTEEEEQAYLRQVAATPTSLYLVAEIAGEIAGTLTFSAAGKRPRVRHAGEFGISIARRYWNLGIGGRMLTYLIDWARQSGIIRKLNLRVRVDNQAAIHLYEKMGFVHEGRISREFYIRGQFIEVYHMGLEIDPLPAT